MCGSVAAAGSHFCRCVSVFRRTQLDFSYFGARAPRACIRVHHPCLTACGDPRYFSSERMGSERGGSAHSLLASKQNGREVRELECEQSEWRTKRTRRQRKMLENEGSFSRLLRGSLPPCHSRYRQTKCRAPRCESMTNTLLDRSSLKWRYQLCAGVRLVRVVFPQAEMQRCK
ncbi:hypothetical protein TGVAND_214100 [Toxoplasma gondii VAND]|uniref:Uncharacterized protein n=1 Tax=Toxoplasma gondii VAND TaxID=933077 RepID=A0A086Q4Z5_TOXGO|nr:hypothetical protein TGVAND_214100 [Toxoplasma gondii VAND]